MALATQCPHCHTTFRVAADQLKLRGGIVRCGTCKEVFDGNAALVDLDAPPPAASTPQPAQAQSDDAFDAPLEAAAEAPVEDLAGEASPGAAFDAELAAIEASAQEAADSEPVYDLEFDLGDNLTPVPASTPQVPPEPAPAPDAELGDGPSDAEIVRAVSQLSEVDVKRAIDELLDAELPEGEVSDAQLPEGYLSGDYVPDGGQPGAALPQVAMPKFELSHAEPPAGAPLVDDLAPLLMRESAVPDTPTPAVPAPAPARPPARKNAKRRPPGPAPVTEAPPPETPVEVEAEPDEPEFVKQGRIEEASGGRHRLLLGAGAGLLALTLVLQAAYTFRNGLAARAPGLKPALVALCEPIGCRVELPAQIEALSIEAGELQTTGTDTFLFSALLRNQSDLAQSWPNIELALTDANDKPLVRRVFTPADYLAPGGAVAKGFGARSEQQVRLNFALAQLKASGYHIAVFYP